MPKDSWRACSFKRLAETGKTEYEIL
uniref:Uncharacterized protein n=1 Tax=Arundo donax TaxID=35708 RepID=A0A0A9FPA8_ARUDO